MKIIKKLQYGWTTAEYLLGLGIIAAAVIAVATALRGKLEGLVGGLPF
jgi:Flp pilus assembly pilin Flp